MRAPEPCEHDTLGCRDRKPHDQHTKVGDGRPCCGWPPRCDSVSSEATEAGEGERVSPCLSRNPEPPHQRCENVTCDGHHRDYPADPGKAETRWSSPAEPDAAEVEKVLAEHQRLASRSGACRCGAWPPVNHGVTWIEHLVEQLAPVLDAARRKAGDDVEACSMFGSHPRGGHNDAVLAAEADAGEGMRQQVIVTQLADRHRDNDRDFAESHEVIARAAALPDVLHQVADTLDLPRGRYTITIGDPYS